MTGQLLLSSGSAAAPSMTFSANNNQGFYNVGAGTIGVAVGGAEVGTITSNGFSNTNGVGTTVPVGTVIDYAGSTAPTGWYLCYGQAVSRTTYATLFGIIGTTYGSGDGSTTFNLPDCRGRVSYGVDNMGGTAANNLTSTYFGTSADALGATGGQQDIALAQTNLPSVNFTVTISSGQGSHQHAPYQGTGTFYGQANETFYLANGNDYPNGALASGVFNDTAPATLPALSGTAASGGSATPFATVPPGITFNKIIFAGA